MITHRTPTELDAGLDHIRQAPQDGGQVLWLVRRPHTETREVLTEAELSVSEGLVGDSWRVRGSSRTPDGTAHPGMQLTLMNARVIALLTQAQGDWQWAGDQLFVDFDLSAANIPPGTRLALGSAVIEISDQPHTGCNKFKERFGAEALKWVSSPVGKALQLRGVNARVLQPGVVRVGDAVKKLY